LADTGCKECQEIDVYNLRALNTLYTVCTDCKTDYVLGLGGCVKKTDIMTECTNPLCSSCKLLLPG
jgi:hypothetical protein